jgi:hypothetical protein
LARKKETSRTPNVDKEKMGEEEMTNDGLEEDTKIEAPMIETKPNKLKKLAPTEESRYRAMCRYFAHDVFGKAGCQRAAPQADMSRGCPDTCPDRRTCVPTGGHVSGQTPEAVGQADMCPDRRTAAPTDRQLSGQMDTCPDSETLSEGCWDGRTC